MTPIEFRARLRAAGYTQLRFAAEAGVDQRTVSRWVQGHQPLPRWAIWIARLLTAG